MQRNGISHLFFSILLEVESFAQVFIVFWRVSAGSEWRPRICPTSQRATGGKPRLIILVCVSVWLLGVSLWRPRRFSSLPVFHIKLPLQKESSNGRTARTVHASLGCRRADADISKSFFLYIHIHIKKFSITFFFLHWRISIETATAARRSVTSANNRPLSRPDCDMRPYVRFLKSIKMLQKKRNPNSHQQPRRPSTPPSPAALQIKPLLHLIERALDWLIFSPAFLICLNLLAVSPRRRRSSAFLLFCRIWTSHYERLDDSAVVRL